MATHPPPISQQEALEIIDQLRAGSRTASERLATVYMEWLALRLRAIFPAGFADEHACYTGAADALISLIKRPEQYDPEKAPLHAFLVRAASDDLRNALRSERRHHVQRRRGAEQPHLRVVELSRLEREPPSDEFDDPAKVVERRETVREALARARPPVPAEVQERLTEAEARVLSLLRDGVRRNEDFAAAMGIGGLPLNEQRKRVKQMKDRLKKRLERARSRHDAT